MLRMLLDLAVSQATPPRTRCQLIERFLDEFLAKWERRQRKQVAGLFVIKQILASVASEMGASVTTIDRLRGLEIIGARYQNLLRDSLAPEGILAVSILEELLTSGLLRRTGSSLAFMHQAIQEFFLARDMLERKLDVSPYVANQQWHETLFYIAELAENPTWIVEKVLKNNPVLAAKCLDLVSTPDRKIVDAVVGKLIDLWGRSEKGWVGAERDLARRILRLRDKASRPLMEILAKYHPKRNAQSKDVLYLSLLHEAGEWEEALQHSEETRFAGQQGDKVNYYAARGLSLQQIGRYEEAITEYQAALGISEHSGWIRARLAACLDARGQTTQAEQEYLRALQDSDSAVTRCNYASLLRKQGRMTEARQQLEKCISRNDKYYSIYSQLGLIESEEKKHENAAASFQKAFELLSPEQQELNGDISLRAGNAWEAAGHNNRAIQAWRVFLDLEPTHRDAPQIYEKILRYEQRDRPRKSHGWVKMWDSYRGYGFIVDRNSAKDVFVHYSAIRMDGFKSLKEYQEVEFEIEEGPRGPRAVNVEVTT